MPHLLKGYLLIATMLLAGTPNLVAQRLDWANGYFNFLSQAAVSSELGGNQIYLTGEGRSGNNLNPNGTAVPIPGPGPAVTPIIFVARYDSLGQPLWVRGLSAKSGGFFSGDNVSSGGGEKIKADPRGYVHVMTHATVGIDKLYPSQQVLNTVAGAALFTFDSVGNLVHQLPILSDSIIFIRAMDLDNQGKLTVVGSFSGEFSFGGKTITSQGKRDGFVLRYDPVQYNPSQTYLGQIGGTELDDCYGVTIDAQGNTYIGGMFRGICDMDPDPAAFDQINIGTDFDAFVVKLNADMEYQWSRRVSTTLTYMGRLQVNSKGIVTVNAYTNALKYHLVSLDGQGNALGTFPLKHVYFPPFTDYSWKYDKEDNLYTLTADSVGGVSNLKLSTYDTSGALVDSVQLISTSTVRLYALDLDPDGGIYLSGLYRGTLDLDPDTSTFLVTATNPTPERTFLVKWNTTPAPDSPMVAVTSITDALTCTVFPNPAAAQQTVHLQLNGSVHGSFMLSIWSLDGKFISECPVVKDTESIVKTINLPAHLKGQYVCILTDAQGSVLAKHQLGVE